MAWIGKKVDKELEPNNITPALIAVLNSLNRESIILDASGNIIFETNKTSLLNLVSEGKVTSEELSALVRVVRRTGKSQEGSIEVARGPIGKGKRELQITATLISPDGSVLILVDDEGEKQRVDVPYLRLKMSQKKLFYLPIKLRPKLIA